MNKRKGFLVFWVLVLFTVSPLLFLVASKTSKHFRLTEDNTRAAAVETYLETLVVSLTTSSSDPDFDGFYELPRETSLNEIPVSVSGGALDVFGTPIKYFTWDLGSENTEADYSNYRATQPPVEKMLGRVISGGFDKVVETGRDSLSPVGDDIVVDIFQQDIERIFSKMEGWIDVGNYVRLIDTTDLVGVHDNVPTTKFEVGGAMVLGSREGSDSSSLAFDEATGRFLVYNGTEDLLADKIPAPKPIDPLASIVVSGDRTLTSADAGQYIKCIDGGSDYTLTLPPDMPAGYFNINIDRGVTHMVHIQAQGLDTINGKPTRSLWAGESAKLAFFRVGEWYKVDGATRALRAKVSFRGLDLEFRPAMNYSYGDWYFLDPPVVESRLPFNSVVEADAPFNDYIDMANSVVRVPRSGNYTVNTETLFTGRCRMDVYVMRNGETRAGLFSDNGFMDFDVFGTFHVSKESGQYVQVKALNKQALRNYDIPCYLTNGGVMTITEVPEW